MASAPAADPAWAATPTSWTRNYVALNLDEGTNDYGAIVKDLKASAAPSTTARAIWEFPWAASHYGYGSAWHSGPVATVAAQGPHGERLTGSTHAVSTDILDDYPERGSARLQKSSRSSHGA